MKPILAVMGGFALSFGMFVAGILFALFVMTGEPPQKPIADANMAEVWSSEPRTVNTKAQAFERLPAVKQGAGDGAVGADSGVQGGGVAVAAAAAQSDGAEPAVDPVTTAAVPASGEALPVEPRATDDPAAARLFTAHAEWCSRRYRSYDAGTNSYSPYNGGRRECMSPYWAEYAALTGAPAALESNERFVPLVADGSTNEGRGAAEPSHSEEYVADDSGGGQGLVIDDQHVQYCFSRYRSYRPEDNTYQPWGGGPRMQCE